MKPSILYVPCVLLNLSGCVTPPPQYHHPDNTPYATIQSSINGAYDIFESIDIYMTRNDVPQRKYLLFSIHKSLSKPSGYIRVPANQKITFEYDEVASGGRTCNIPYVATLKEGHQYSLVGGFAYKNGLIPIISGYRLCQFGITEDTAESY